MMLDPRILAALASAGATPDMIVAAVKADHAIEEERAAARRAKGAERKRRSRERLALSRGQSVTSRDDAGHGVTERDTSPPPSSPSSSPPTPSLITTPPSSPTPAPSLRSVAARDHTSEKVSRGTRLPDDWQPSDADLKFASNLGLALYAIDIEATKFRNYWTNRTDQQSRKRDWSRAWQNWILNVKPNGGPNGHRPANGAHKSGGDDFFAGLASVATNIAGDGGVARPAAEEIPLGRVNIDG